MPVDSDDRLGGARRFGKIIGTLVGAVGVCVGGAAFVIAVLPRSALWMGPIVCPNPYRLAVHTSHYGDTSAGLQCVSGASSYDANAFAIDGMQSLLIAAVLGAVAVLAVLLRRRARRPA